MWKADLWCQAKPVEMAQVFASKAVSVCGFGYYYEITCSRIRTGECIVYDQICTFEFLKVELCSDQFTKYLQICSSNSFSNRY